LTRQKDFETLIRAFAMVRYEINCRLVILGEGEDRQKLIGLAKELNVHQWFELPGFVDNPNRYMNQAEVFVLSSAWEGFGNVLVEAMAEGTHVIATDCPNGPREILMDGKIGILIPAAQPQIMAEAIKRTIMKPGSTSPLVERAADFSIKKAGDAYRRYLFKPENLKD
jgi:glycosyltransferase involved in cell wall biosynthesis